MGGKRKIDYESTQKKDLGTAPGVYIKSLKPFQKF
jgi:hypothetical protein